MAASAKRHHICPPSNAKHPADRWETAFVYAFITRFTSLKHSIEGFEGAMELAFAYLRDQILSLELAVLRDGPDPLLAKILAAFILNLRPNARNVGQDIIGNTVASVLNDFMRTPERSIFWDEELGVNVDPLANLEGGYWTASWDIKLRILRQLVEYQLTHSTQVRAMIDGAWGVKAAKHKKKTADSGPPPPEDPNSIQNLSLVPIGQDVKRLRYWVIDDSPRVYRSSNPWKVSAKFDSVATSRDDYLALVERLKNDTPLHTAGSKRNRMEHNHTELIRRLEGRISAIDSDIHRIEKLRKKIAQRDALLALAASVPETRSRRQTKRPDYVYDDVDTHMDDEYQDEEYDDDDDVQSSSSVVGRRRSSRNGGTKRSEADSYEWRGERRSSRLGALPPDVDSAPPPKRARTGSSPPPDRPLKRETAASVKPNEFATDTIAGKKKSKFWFYAVEPSQNPNTQEENGPTEVNGEKSTEPSIDESTYEFEERNGSKRSRLGDRGSSVTSLSDQESTEK